MLTRKIERVGTADARFFPGLQDLHDPPARLYYRGNLNALSRPLVAVIGSRVLSQSAAIVARLAGRYVSDVGAAVVSGGAPGADSIAVKACLDGGIPPVLVLACGLDEAGLRSLSPEQRHAIEEVLAIGGLLLSEQPEGTPARGEAFLARNRLIIAISRAVVVCSAALRSGTMSAAWRALELDRPLIVPQPAPSARRDPGSAGLLLLSEPQPIGVPALRGARCPARLMYKVLDRAPLAHLLPQNPAELGNVIRALATGSPDGRDLPAEPTSDPLASA